MPIHDRSVFENAYAGQAPWDIGKPQRGFVDAANEIHGAVLDAGCGTGDSALFLAARGCKVTGIDFLDEPIWRAKKKAAEQKSSAVFLTKDALTLKEWTERFDAVIDSGLFHVFSDDDRRRYVAGLATILKPGGRLFLMCFSNEEPGEQGPRRVSKQDLYDAFVDGWDIESIQPCRFETRPDLKDLTFSEGGPKAWFAIVRRSDVPRVETIVETSIYADDLESMESFYTMILGLPVIGKEAGRHVFFRVGARNVLLVFNPDTTLLGNTLPAHGARGPSHFAIGIAGNTLEKWRQHLAGNGIAIEKEVTWPRGGRSIYFRDPAGNSLEIITPGVWDTPDGW